MAELIFKNENTQIITENNEIVQIDLTEEEVISEEANEIFSNEPSCFVAVHIGIDLTMNLFIV